jgi:hypothetical protein
VRPFGPLWKPVEQTCRNGVCAGTVGERVVQFQQQRELAVRQAGDEIQVPQGFSGVERLRHPT